MVEMDVKLKKINRVTIIHLIITCVFATMFVIGVGITIISKLPCIDEWFFWNVVSTYNSVVLIIAIPIYIVISIPLFIKNIIIIKCRKLSRKNIILPIICIISIPFMWFIYMLAFVGLTGGVWNKTENEQ